MSERTIQFTITVDTDSAVRALARVLIALWRSKPDPNPMPRFHLFTRHHKERSDGL